MASQMTEKPDCAIIPAMNPVSPARARFRILMRQTEEQLDLAEAALCIAWEDQGGDCPPDAMGQLDWLAAAARLRLSGIVSPSERVAALNAMLFEDLGFRGNTWQYDDPANSYIDRALATRCGLPITLSLIYIEIGRRLGMPMSGVALPGHFLVRYSAPEGEIYIDPFRAGRIWSRAECEQQIAAVYGEVAPAVIAQVMAAPSKRAIIVRMLRNLKSAFMERAESERALAAIERILLVAPGESAELRDRGLLRLRSGALHLALTDFERYAQAEPAAPDLAVLRLQLSGVARQLALIN